MDPEFDLLTGLRNQASTKIHWYSLLGGTALTAPCDERINDNYKIKVYNPEQEAAGRRKKMGLIAGAVGLVAGILGFVAGRWIGRRKERRENDMKRKYSHYDSSDERKAKKRRALEREYATRDA